MEIRSQFGLESAGPSKVLNYQSQDTCFLCCNVKITPELSAAALQMQGIPDTNEDKLNILKVICQLLRVRWEVMGSLFSSHNVNFPFCIGCLKVIIEIIFLREKLIKIESEIRDKIGHIENSIAQLMGTSITCGSGRTRDDEFDCKLEPPESYEECRQLFQVDIFNEHQNKQLLRKKIDELNKNVVGTTNDFQPSMVQLQLQKNLFGVNWQKVEDVQAPSKSANLELTESLPPLSQENFELRNNNLTLENVPEREAFKIRLAHQYFDNQDGTRNVGDCTRSGSKLKKLQKFELTSLDEEIEDAEYFGGFSDESKATDSDFRAESSDSNESDEETGRNITENPENITTENATGTLLEPKSIPTKRKSSREINKSTTQSERGVFVPSRIDYSDDCVSLQHQARTLEGKDGEVWSTQPPPTAVKTRAYNILKEDGGLMGNAKNTKLTPVEMFKLMFPPAIINTIVTYTNENAEITRSKTGMPDWKPVTVDELYAYIGILIYLGVYKKKNVPLPEIWTSDPKYVVPCITATMSRNRFADITQHLRFDDRAARHEAQTKGIEQSKLGYISSVFNPFVLNMRSHFRPYEHIVVNEMFAGRKEQNIDPTSVTATTERYAMKIWALRDAATGYILRLAIYEGKIGETLDTELGKKVVLGLVENYFKSGRVVVTDDSFTSKILGLELMKQNMGLLGTLAENRIEVIPEFYDGKGKELQSSVFAFQKDFTMVSHIQRKNKSVVFLSTAHHSPQINPKMKNQPLMILEYNDAKRVVGDTDQLIAHYSCQRKSLRWPVKLFHAMIDIGAFNAYIIWKIHQGNEMNHNKSERRHFLQTMAASLMEPNIAMRSQRVEYHSVIKGAMTSMGYKPTRQTPPVDTTETGRTRGWCGFCPRSTRCRSRCDTCRQFICTDHCVKITHCPNCMFLPQMEVAKMQKKKALQTRIVFGISDTPS